MGWIKCVLCEKFWCDFVEQTFALVAPVQPILYRASCSNKTIQNASTHNKTHQNMSLGPNGVDRVHSLRKIQMRLRCKNFCINCTSPTRFAPTSCSNETIQNALKHFETQQYMSLGSNGKGRVYSLRKIPKQLHGKNLCINCPSATHFAPNFV